MTALELITELMKIVVKKGDLPVVYDNPEGYDLGVHNVDATTSQSPHDPPDTEVITIS